MGKNAINETNFQYLLFVTSCTPDVKRVLRYNNLKRVVILFFFYEENAGLPDREARPWLLSEHGFTHAVMQVSDCKNKEKKKGLADLTRPLRPVLFFTCPCMRALLLSAFWI